MNIKMQQFLSDFGVTLTSNLVSMLISSIVVLIIPTIIGISDYGFWQLYIFYCSYTSYFSFGLTDGVYIRNGGKNYNDLDFSSIKSQYYVLIVINIILTFIITLFFIFQNTSLDKVLVAFFACLSAIIIIPRSLLTMTMLSVNRIKENAIVIIVEKLIYFFLIILFLIFKIKNFYFLIFSDLLGQIISSILAIYYCKDLVIGKTNITFKKVLNETRINIAIGIKIVMAGLASMLIVGIVRFGIEQNWGVEEFAKVSLTISICNLFLIFIKAISVVIFPVLCNCKREVLEKIFSFSRDSIGILLLGVFVFYYPIRIILTWWLPEYSVSLVYMAILFPISLYESKTQLLFNTYFKALRKENILLFINVLTVIFSAFCSYITIYVINSVDLCILSIVVLLGFRCYFSEFILLKTLGIKETNSIILEIILSILFIMLNWIVGGITGMIIYLFVYILFIIIKRKKLLFIKNSLCSNLFKRGASCS